MRACILVCWLVTTKRTRRKEQTFEILKLFMLVMNWQQKMATFVGSAKRNKKHSNHRHCKPHFSSWLVYHVCLFIIKTRQNCVFFIRRVHKLPYCGRYFQKVCFIAKNAVRRQAVLYQSFDLELQVFSQ